MRILMIGDIVGRPGRQAVAHLLPRLRTEQRLDFVIANGENAAGGRGLTPAIAEELLAAGVDVITTGNHVWAQRDLLDYLERDVPVLRPLNYPPGVPGRGVIVVRGVRVVNLLGRAGLQCVDCPFRAVDALLRAAPEPAVTIVDFHAEMTSEKVAMGWYLAGRVSAVLGTHTHVPTADARVLPGGTACVADVGMVGPLNSVLGMETERVIRYFTTGLPLRLEVADGPVQFNSVLVEVDPTTGRARQVCRLDLVV